MGKNLGYITLLDIESNMSQTFKIKDIYDNCIEYDKGIVDMSHTTKYFDIERSAIHYFTEVDTFIKQEITALHTLRRSTALKNMFDVKKDGDIDYMKFVPYLIIVLLIFFK